jgi:hypothetical protein
VNSSVDIVELVTNPPILSFDPLNKKTLLVQSSIQSALTLECIRNLRNQVEHNGGDLNLRTIMHSLELRVLEHISTIEDEKVSIDSPSVSC